MFEDNYINETDIMMKSILEGGQEEVPAHIWDGVEGGLDKLAQRRKVIFLWRRAGIAVAAAAVVAMGVFLSSDRSADFVPEPSQSGMIAVAQEPLKAQDTADEPAPLLLAETKLPKAVTPTATVPTTAEPATYESAVHEQTEPVDTAEKETETPATSMTSETKETAHTVKKEADEYFPTEWGEEEQQDRREHKTSIVMSGLAGTNSSSEKVRIGPSKRPTMEAAPTKTGITENNSRNTYGLPVSVGTGVKIYLTDRWSLSAGFNYTLLTRRFYGRYTHINEAGVEDNTISSDIRNSQHYVGIPVNAYYDIVEQKHLNFYAYAGGTVEKCVSDRYQVLNTSITHKEKVQGVQLSANAGIGVEFLLGQHLGLYIDPSLRYYFKGNQPKSIRTAQPLMLGFEMGLRIRL